MEYMASHVSKQPYNSISSNTGHIYQVLSYVMINMQGIFLKIILKFTHNIILLIYWS